MTMPTTILRIMKIPPTLPLRRTIPLIPFPPPFGFSPAQPLTSQKNLSPLMMS
uniref:Uncharacterized protein n=1 Tax=Anopheles quadriannulatus TaxID=34691 RepID=A0A182XU38_ANOQN